MKVRWGVVAIVASVMAVSLLAFGLVAGGPDTTVRAALGDRRPAPVPRFELDVLEVGSARAAERRWQAALRQGAISAEDLRGSPTVINIWASWCDPCREEAAVLEEGWRRHRREGVKYLGIDTQDLFADAREFIAEFAITYPSVRNPDGATADDFGLTGVPETYFLDADGRVVAMVIGVIERNTLDSGVAAAVSGTPAGILDSANPGFELKPESEPGED